MPLERGRRAMRSWSSCGDNTLCQRQFPFFVNTDITQLYSLCTVPIKWTKLKECNKIIHPLYMEAGQQALNSQLSRFVIARDYKMAWQTNDLFGRWVRDIRNRRIWLKQSCGRLASTLERGKGDRPSLLCSFFFSFPISGKVLP